MNSCRSRVMHPMISTYRTGNYYW